MLSIVQMYKILFVLHTLLYYIFALAIVPNIRNRFRYIFFVEN